MSSPEDIRGRIHWGNGIRNDVPVSNRIGRLIYETSLVRQKSYRVWALSGNNAGFERLFRA